jgi:hypothetical protein
VTDKKYDISHRAGEQEEPRVDKPLHGPKRPKITPLLLLLAFVAALVAFYFFGLEVLIPAD